jgi:hypothetical protein
MIMALGDDTRVHTQAQGDTDGAVLAARSRMNVPARSAFFVFA